MKCFISRWLTLIAVPVSVFGQIYFQEDFESGLGAWTAMVRYDNQLPGGANDDTPLVFDATGVAPNPTPGGDPIPIQGPNTGYPGNHAAGYSSNFAAGWDNNSPQWLQKQWPAKVSPGLYDVTLTFRRYVYWSKGPNPNVWGVGNRVYVLTDTLYNAPGMPFDDNPFPPDANADDGLRQTRWVGADEYEDPPDSGQLVWPYNGVWEDAELTGQIDTSTGDIELRLLMHEKDDGAQAVVWDDVHLVVTPAAGGNPALDFTEDFESGIGGWTYVVWMNQIPPGSPNNDAPLTFTATDLLLYTNSSNPGSTSAGYSSDLAEYDATSEWIQGQFPNAVPADPLNGTTYNVRLEFDRYVYAMDLSSLNPVGNRVLVLTDDYYNAPELDFDRVDLQSCGFKVQYWPDEGNNNGIWYHEVVDRQVTTKTGNVEVRLLCHDKFAGAQAVAWDNFTLRLCSSAPVRTASFDESIEGWSISGGGLLEHVDFGGFDDAGFLKITDTSDADLVLEASSAFHGDLRAFNGGTLSFYAMMDENPNPPRPAFGTLTITDGVNAMSLDIVPGNPLPYWEDMYSVAFSATAWGVSEEQWQSLLSHVTDIAVNMQAVVGAGEVLSFDSFILTASSSMDCDQNGEPDWCEMPNHDCNDNLMLDSCDLASGTSQDCNTNGVPDECDINTGTSQDCNANGVPDECDVAPLALASPSDVALPEGFNADGVVTADLNGDGKLDLAAIYTEGITNNVAVLLGNGDGTFAAATAYTAHNNPESITAADLDRDGAIDLIVPNRNSGDVSLLWNNGAGVFPTKTSLAVWVPRHAAAADLDGDGDPDLAVANRDGGNVLVFTNDGSGSFTPGPSLPAGNWPYHVAAADLEGDGDVDLAVVNYYSNDVTVLLNNGNATFAPGTSLSIGWGPHYIAAADMDGDGDIDLLVVNVNDDQVALMRNNGSGAFAVTTVSVGDAPSSVTAGDLDRDGDLDLAVANELSKDVTVRLNQSDGTFPATLVLPMGKRAWETAIGDLNQDGKPDLAVAAHSLKVLLNQTPPASSPDCNHNQVPDECEPDVDGDQVIDACDNCPNTVPGSPVDVHGCPPLIPGDFNRDGDVDRYDYAVFAGCASGPGIPRSGSPTCQSADLNPDNDVDQADFAVFQRCYSGENVPAVPNCAD
jgi:hypothetical protein